MQPVLGVDAALVLDDARDAASVLRLAAVAGVAGRHVSTDDAPAWWRTAAAVVVDDVSARQLVEARMPRRDHVLLVTTTPEVGDRTWRMALELGADRVIALSDEADVAEWLARLGEPAGSAKLVGFMSARGGAGASTLAATLALAAADHRDVLLLDGDLQAGGIDYLLGVESTGGARWPELSQASGVVPASTLAEALPSAGRLRVLAARAGGHEHLSSAGIDAVVEAARRGHDLVVADVIRIGPLSAALAASADAMLLVVPCEVRAAVTAAALVRDLARRCSDVRLVVRPGRGALRPHDVATAVGAPVAALWPWERRLDTVVETGGFCRGWRRSRAAGIAATLLGELVG